MCNDDRRDAQPLLKQFEFHLHLFAKLRVKSGERLVEQEEPRIERQRACDCYTLPLPAGQLRNGAVTQTGKTNQIEKLVCPRAASLPIFP